MHNTEQNYNNGYNFNIFIYSTKFITRVIGYLLNITNEFISTCLVTLALFFISKIFSYQKVSKSPVIQLHQIKKNNLMSTLTATVRNDVN